MFKFDMNLNELLYEDLPINTFANRITKAKLYAGISQEELSKLTGLSRSTINDLEAGYRNEINKNTLLKLLSVLN
ncbi:helix-turn-helix domain-containing protein, partial [Clostridium butyricum]|uniref:helix-turn-helix domain-containing protein n=1 Tax=Clostridium butyricum TaxID=1492 RepID=UPI00325C200F